MFMNSDKYTIAIAEIFTPMNGACKMYWNDLVNISIVFMLPTLKIVRMPTPRIVGEQSLLANSVVAAIYFVTLSFGS